MKSAPGGFSPPESGPFRQVAALPVREGPDGAVEVLLLTSRETKRWVIPKGWPMKGKKPWEAAAREALEEAGLVGEVGREPIGRYVYFKRRNGHFDACEVEVFLLAVVRQKASYREKRQREMIWTAPAQAAELVQEQGLAVILAGLERELRPAAAPAD